jgi:hypothetical protein
VERPRLLLVPNLTEVEWVNRPHLERWADVASYDAPGIGDEPPVDKFDSRAIGRRGLDELERRGWDRCVVVADEFGVTSALRLTEQAPEVVQAMVIGHARMSNSTQGERPAVNREVHAACSSLIRNDPRSFLHQMFRMTQGELMQGGYTNKLVDEYRRRVPIALLLPFWESRLQEGEEIEELLRGLDVPMLLAEHRGCLMYTREGFEDAVAALPRAQSASFDDKPSTSPEFADVLERFCHEHVAVAV